MATRNERLARIVQRRLDLRKSLWPEIDETELWTRQIRDGWVTIPRTMSIFIHLMNNLSPGKPLGPTYLEMWCRSYDDCLVILSNPREMAYHSGFTGQRAERTWLSRIAKLRDHGFMYTKPGPNGPVSYALIRNPYLVVQKLYDEKRKGLGDELYYAIRQRAVEIGADDFDEILNTNKKLGEAENPGVAEMVDATG